MLLLILTDLRKYGRHIIFSDRNETWVVYVFTQQAQKPDSNTVLSKYMSVAGS